MSFLTFLRANANWLAAGFLLAFTSSYGQTFFISIFAGEIREEFGLSHGQWGGIYTLGTTVSAALMIWAGSLTDVMRVRVLAPLTILALAASCLWLAGASAAWSLPFIILALRFFGQGMCSHITSVAMSRWFIASRGRALAVAALGYSTGTAFLPLAFVALKSVFEWRALWVLAAFMALAAIVPILLLLRQERTPQSIAKETPAVGMMGRHWRRGEMMRGALFWLLLPAILGPAAWNTSLFFHQVHYAEVQGWTHAQFVALIPILTAVVIASTFASGWAVDRFGAGRLMYILLLPYVAGYLILGSSSSLPLALLGLCTSALGIGAMATLPGAFAAEYYGTKHIGGIKAVWTAVMVLGSALGPGITGWFIDLGVDFPQQMIWISLYFAMSAGLLAWGVERARPLLSAPA